MKTGEWSLKKAGNTSVFNIDSYKAFFIRRKNVSFLRYLEFCVFVKYKDIKIGICHIMEGKLYACFFWILATIKMKFGQVLVCCVLNMSNMFLGQCWRLETSSRSFYDFIKTTIYGDPAIFHSWHLPFLIVFYSPFQKNETLESWRNWLLGNWSGCYIAYIYQMAKFGDLMSCGSKDI